eukprot:scaffold52287_cov63-Attheya_sp.AAC.1
MWAKQPQASGALRSSDIYCLDEKSHHGSLTAVACVNSLTGLTYQRTSFNDGGYSCYNMTSPSCIAQIA